MTEQSARRLLFIAHTFPPSGSGGVQRPLKFVKFLTRLGWQVTVVTTQATLFRDLHGMHDPTLLDEVPATTEVVRIPSDEGGERPPRRLGIPGIDRLRSEVWRFRQGPDLCGSWCERSYARFAAVPHRSDWSVILATGNPFSSFLLARKLARRLRLPYVLDFRDPWYTGNPSARRSPLSRARRWERTVIQDCAWAVFVTEEMRRRCAEAYSRHAERLSVIENGVDLEEPWRREPVALDRERFEVVYTGTLPRYRSPGGFLRGFRLACDRSPEFARRSRFVVAGKFGFADADVAENRALVEQLGLSEWVIELGYRPHADVVRMQRSAGALLSLVGMGTLAASGKSYEYVAAGRPVLAFQSRIAPAWVAVATKRPSELKAKARSLPS